MSDVVEPSGAELAVMEALREPVACHVATLELRRDFAPGIPDPYQHLPAVCLQGDPAANVALTIAVEDETTYWVAVGWAGVWGVAEFFDRPEGRANLVEEVVDVATAVLSARVRLRKAPLSGAIHAVVVTGSKGVYTFDVPKGVKLAGTVGKPMPYESLTH